MNLSDQELEKLRRSFSDFGGERSDTPPMYKRLGPWVAEHDELLQLLSHVEHSKQRPVTLFAAVHYLVLCGTDHPLARSYSAPESRDSLDEAGPRFSSFCEDYESDIIEIMRDRSVQTNEVNRCAGLLPALMEVHAATGKQLALVELGASAGLNLLFDRFRYDYAGGPVIGLPGAHVRCHCELRGTPPRFSAAMPPVEQRIGIDTAPIDISDDDELLWLKACIWVGDVAREQRLEAAAELARREWPKVKRGDSARLLPAVADDIDAEFELVIFNSWMMSWMPEEARAQLEQTVRSIAQDRTVWWITYEWPTKVSAFVDDAGSQRNADSSLLGLQKLSNSGVQARKLANIAHHGQWMEWLPE